MIIKAQLEEGNGELASSLESGEEIHMRRSIRSAQLGTVWHRLREKCLFSEELLLWDYRDLVTGIVLISINNTVSFISLVWDLIS